MSACLPVAGRSEMEPSACRKPAFGGSHCCHGRVLRRSRRVRGGGSNVISLKRTRTSDGLDFCSKTSHSTPVEKAPVRHRCTAVACAERSVSFRTGCGVGCRCLRRPIRHTAPARHVLSDELTVGTCVLMANGGRRFAMLHSEGFSEAVLDAAPSRRTLASCGQSRIRLHELDPTSLTERHVSALRSVVITSARSTEP